MRASVSGVSGCSVLYALVCRSVWSIRLHEHARPSALLKARAYTPATQAEAMVVGHTIQPTGRVTFRCNRRLVMTDVGMSHAIRPTARAAILRATMQLNGSVAALTPMQ
mmetsp:Transcript_32010/g.61651  ORF Transcript_32010/g.61651 Transcript_32010/m.61651 type:complete len:109 (+) Transcript_32010:1220-1546(+)